MNGSSAPLVVDVKPDVMGLERLVSKRQMTMLLERGPGNGNGNGNGHGNGNGEQPQPSSIDIPGESWLSANPQAPASAPAPVNPWEKPITAPAPPAPEPSELSFVSAPEPAPQPAPATGMFFADAANAVGATSLQTNSFMQPPGPGQTLVETPDQQPTNPAAVINPPFGALQNGIPQAPPPMPGEAALAPVPVPAPVNNDAPPVQGGGGDFFNSAPGTPPPIGAPAQNQGATIGQTVATAAVGAAVGAVVGVAAAKTFDFFNAPPVSGEANSPTSAPAQADGGAAPQQDATYATGERSDFFAASPGAQAPQKVSSEVPPPPVSGLETKPSNSQQNLPAGEKHSFEDMVTAGGKTVDSPASSGFDFFAAAPLKESKKSHDDELFPDETHLRGKSKTKEAPPSVSLYADDDDDIKPKIARPRGYTPKESSSGKDSDGDKVKDEDDEDSTFYKDKDKPPARRSFSGNSPSKAGKKKSDDDDDEEAPLPKKKDGFLKQDVNLLGMTMSRQNQIMLIGIFAFVGIVFFNMIGSLLGGMPASAPPKPAVTALPNLSGDWKVQFTEDPSSKGHLMAVLAVQKGLEIQGKGSDEYGEFTIAGTVIPPDRIQLRKKYTGAEDQKPVLFEGQFVLGSEPLYSRGRWTLKHVVGKFLHAQVRQDGGSWEANYYVRNATPDGSPAPAAVNDMPWDKFNRWMATMDFSTKSMFAAITVIGGAIVVLFGSLSIFGPSGKMNVWEKQKYIPSQFRAQHNKMVRELGKVQKTGGLPLGRRKEWRPWLPWVTKDLCIPPEVRENDPHLLILGAGDKGKTRLMATMISSDIEAGDRAVIVIDSDGGLTDIITRWVSAHPKSRELASRVTLLDPTYKGNTLGYNPLEMPEDEDLQSAASSLVYGFKAIYTEPPGAQSQWNQQTANILRNAALLLMVNGKTLTDLPALLNDNDFRDVLLESIEKKKKEKAEYITLLDTWGQYKRLARTDQWINWVEPILNRVGPMLSDSRIRSILTKPVGDIRLRQIIKERKVLIVKVAKGQLDQNANLLGSLIVTGVKQAALSLANEAAGKQPHVALYLDEFDNFIEKDTIEAITSETDKFKIGFIGCIKTLQHLPEDFRNQLIIAVGTMACFALAKKDGDLLGPQMFRVDGRKIKHQTIQNFFNKVNTSPQFELISDEEKLNIDRVVGQEERTFFCYRVGTVAGVFNLKSHDFNDIPDAQVKKKVIDKMHGIIPDKDKDKEAKKKETA
jgi:Type IV secretion-system coupling protein DNA-binding domain